MMVRAGEAFGIEFESYSLHLLQTVSERTRLHNNRFLEQKRRKNPYSWFDYDEEVRPPLSKHSNCGKLGDLNIYLQITSMQIMSSFTAKNI